MLRSHTITDPDDTFVIADFHLNHGHPTVIAGVGAQSATEHDNEKRDRWNAVVRDTSTVYHLGDLAIRDETGEHLKHMLKQLRFKKLVLLWGNHNSGSQRLYRKALMEHFRNMGANKPEQYAQDYELYPVKLSMGSHQTIEFPGHYLELKVRSPDYPDLIVLMHYAIRNWLHSGRDSWMLCGHSHGNDPGIHRNTGEGKILDCGYESLSRPHSISEIKAIMAQRHTITHDHH